MKKILIVEDDNFLQKALGFVLKESGYKIFKAVDGEEALEMARRELPDLVLLDLIIPKKNGFDVLEELKGNDKTRELSVLILSNLGQKEDVERGMELGAAGYIIKAHFKLNEVVEKINNLLK